MIEATRRAYLEALGFDVWVARPEAPARDVLGLGAGRGGTLLVCRSADESRSELAGDLCRALADDPVWAWLNPSADEDGRSLEDIVSSHLITRVLLFGRDPARQLFQGAPPGVVGSAEVVELPGLEDLAVSAPARQALWRKLRKFLPSGGSA
jgi:hypothetical protein